jgi:uroporphyrinogen III methyltransferase / synthase
MSALMNPEQPLKNHHILVTRTMEQSGGLIARIRKYGGETTVIPMIRITEPDSWEQCDRAIVHLRKYDGVIFTSINGADAFVGRIREQHPHAFRLLFSKNIYAIGSNTASFLKESGLPSNTPGDVFDAEHLTKMIAAEDPAGKYFLFPAGNLRLGTVERNLEASHAVVDVVEVYRTEKPDPENAERLKRLIDDRSVTILTFFSPSSVDNFFGIIDRTSVRDIPIAVIGKTTLEAVRRHNLEPSIIPEVSDTEALVEAIVGFVCKSQGLRD